MPLEAYSQQTKERNTMNMFVPYNLATEIEKHFEGQGEEPFNSKEFYDIVETLQAAGSTAKKQAETATFFKSLSRTEVVGRSAQVARLGKLLQTIKLNRNVISCAST